MPRSNKGLGRCHKSGTGNNQGRRRTTPFDNRGFNRNNCHSKSIDMSLPVISVSLPLNNSVINPPQLSLVCQKPSSSSPKKTHESQASSIPGRTSPDTSNTMPPPPTNDGNHNIYGCMVDVSKLTPAKIQQHAVMLLAHYHKLCNTNDPHVTTCRSEERRVVT